MNEEFLLQAIGHIDEELIVQAEEYRPARHSRSWQRPVAGLAACLAIVFALRWGMNHLGMGSAGGASGNSMASGSGEAPQENETTTSTDNSYHSNSGDWCPAIMVDGQLYWSTGEILSAVEESVPLDTTTYTDGLPDQDGEANFAREGALYSRTEEGVAVQLDGAWVLFLPERP